jgi:hypothetical protein
MEEYRRFTFTYDSTLEKPFQVDVFKEIDGKVIIDFRGTFETQEEAAEAFLSANVTEEEEE